MADLFSRNTVGNVGFLPSGGSGSSSSGSGGFNYGNIAQGVVPLLLSAFGPKNQFQGQTADLASQLQKMSTGIGAQGQKTAGQGTDALSGILKYFQDLAGGDPNAVLSAAGPDRARIIDQYDTAKKALSTAPRGGGATSAALNLETRKAGDLATATQTARASGAAGATQIGSTLLNAGTQQEGQAITGIDSALKAFEQLSKDKTADLASWGTVIGKSLPFLLAGFGL